MKSKKSTRNAKKHAITVVQISGPRKNVPSNLTIIIATKKMLEKIVRRHVMHVMVKILML